MRVLLIGGSHQGKLAYAKDRWRLETVYDGSLGFSPELSLSHGVNRLDLLVLSMLREGREPVEELYGIFRGREDWVVLCDEVGCGVVPVEALDRLWRNRVGELCSLLASRAHVVERIACGLPLRLKG